MMMMVFFFLFFFGEGDDDAEDRSHYFNYVVGDITPLPCICLHPKLVNCVVDCREYDLNLIRT